MSKSRLVQVPEDQQSTRKRKLDNCDKTETKVEPRPKKAKQDEEPRQIEDDELNRLVPIKNVFSDKMAMLEDLRREFPGTELVKVAKFILNVNDSVKNSIAMTLSLDHGRREKSPFPFLTS